MEAMTFLGEKKKKSAFTKESVWAGTDFALRVVCHQQRQTQHYGLPTVLPVLLLETACFQAEVGEVG